MGIFLAAAAQAQRPQRERVVNETATRKWPSHFQPPGSDPVPEGAHEGAEMAEAADEMADAAFADAAEAEAVAARAEAEAEPAAAVGDV